MAEEVVSTVFLAGFPPDATPRELDNLCRFLPGFVTSNVSTAKGTTLFVLFDDPANAHAAIEVLNGQIFDRSQPGEPMRAVMARNNMRRPGGAPAPVAHYGSPYGAAPVIQPPPPSGPPPPGHPGTTNGAPMAIRRPRMPEDPSQVDTVASVGAVEVGIDEASLRAFYQQLPGFLDFKGNPRMGGGFAKFASVELAVQAIQVAQESGIPAEMARSSMSSSFTHPASASPPPPRTMPPPTSLGGPPMKRPRMPEDPSNVDTVASVGAREAGMDDVSLEAFFATIPGFVAFKPNPRMGGGFAKFASSAYAVAAVQMAQESGVPAEMAKSSMSAV